MIKFPCHNCDKRYPGCHTNCDAYKDARLKLDNEKDARTRELLPDYDRIYRTSKIKNIYK